MAKKSLQQQTAIIVRPDQTFESGLFHLAQTNLTVEGEPSYDEWEECLNRLRRFEGASQWWIGDALNFGEREYGEKYAAAVNPAEADLWRQYAYVAGRVTLSTRINNLTWSHHREVAKLAPVEQQQLLQRAAKESWTVVQLRQAVRALAHQQKAKTDQDRHLTTGEFSVICADPPWDYNNSGFDQAAASQYPTLNTGAICALPVDEPSFPKISNDAVLFLWVTSPMLPDGIRVLEAWGFQYRACMVWLKDRAPGLGWWLNTKHELVMIGERGESLVSAASGELYAQVLIGERGSLQPLLKHDSVIHARVGKHSEKPASLYEAISVMYPDLPKVELFARLPRDGWDRWGNEV